MIPSLWAETWALALYAVLLPGAALASPARWRSGFRLTFLGHGAFSGRVLRQAGTGYYLGQAFLARGGDRAPGLTPSDLVVDPSRHAVYAHHLRRWLMILNALTVVALVSFVLAARGADGAGYGLGPSLLMGVWAVSRVYRHYQFLRRATQWTGVTTYPWWVRWFTLESWTRVSLVRFHYRVRALLAWYGETPSPRPHTHP